MREMDLVFFLSGFSAGLILAMFILRPRGSSGGK